MSRLNYLELCHGLINHSVWGKFLLWKQHEEVEKKTMNKDPFQGKIFAMNRTGQV